MVYSEKTGRSVGPSRGLSVYFMYHLPYHRARSVFPAKEYFPT